ncbi:MAG TPA: Ig-like domain-containing protein [Polyangiaceae bacterium]|nr:Ig-like domain-containing protein [Polyangiaceae bacterium]
MPRAAALLALRVAAPLAPALRLAALLAPALRLAALLAPLAACDRGTPAPEPPPPLAIVAQRPEAEETLVPLNRPLRLRFDRFLRPDSVARQSFRVTGGTFDPMTGAPVVGNEFLEPFYDVAERAVVFRLPEGERWVPRTRYTVTVWRATDNNGFGFRSIDGAELAATLNFGFLTGDADDPAEPPRPPVVSYCGRCEGGAFVPGARDVLQRCASAGCHGDDNPTPPLGLRLGSSASIAQSAFDLPARETLRGPSVNAVQRNGPAFGVNMARIDPDNPGWSFLLYKVLLREDAYVPVGDFALPASLGPLPLPGEGPPSAAALEFLGGRFVTGSPMPPDGPALGSERVRLLQAWLASGAPLDDDAACPSACPP